MSSEYTIFAQYYDTLTKNVDYEEIAEHYDKLVEQFCGEKGILLDLACGTGSLSEALAKRGYDVIGVDNSQEMLSIALDKKYDSGLPIQYLCQDITELDMYGTIDVTVSSLDCMNHLDSLDEIKKAFERVSLFAFPHGLFIFDMNTPYKHRTILADNVFVYDEEQVYCVWQNSYFTENNRVEIQLDFFEKNDNGSYERFEESFSECAYDTEVIEKLLAKTGFELLGKFDGFTENPPHKTSERIVYVARKK